MVRTKTTSKNQLQPNPCAHLLRFKRTDALHNTVLIVAFSCTEHFVALAGEISNEIPILSFLVSLKEYLVMPSENLVVCTKCMKSCSFLNGSKKKGLIG